MKTVVQLDNQGYYIGKTIADESPLEPGIYLMPAGAIDTAAPVVPEGKCARWVNHRWVFESLPEVAVEQDPRIVEIESLQRQVTILEDRVSSLQAELSKLSNIKDQLKSLSGALGI